MLSTEHRFKHSLVSDSVYDVSSSCKGGCFFLGYMNNKGIAIEASFSPDSQFIFSGSTEGRIHVWNADTGSKVCVLNGDHPNPVQCVQFNPKYMMLVSACTNLGFWLPSIEEE